MDLLRRIPPLTVSLPLACENKVTAFRERILELKSKYDIKVDTFGVMDEVPLKLKPLGTSLQLNIQVRLFENI